MTTNNSDEMMQGNLKSRDGRPIIEPKTKKNNGPTTDPVVELKTWILRGQKKRNVFEEQLSKIYS
jgi:hypothetical protein